MPSTALYTSPSCESCPIPIPVDPQTRVKELRAILAEEFWQFQKPNILKLIGLYESGQLMPPFVGERVWLCNGNVLAKEPGMEDISGYKVIWAEVSTLLHYIITVLSSMIV